MRVFGKLIPDAEFADVCDISAEWLASKGIRAVALDMDNTLAKYSERDPSPEVAAWLESLRASGIGAMIVSNTHRPARVERHAKALGVEYLSHAGKPSRKGFRLAAEKLGVRPSEIMAIGDQVFTDIWGAKRTGCAAVIVYPRGMEENVFFRLRRAVELPFIALCKERYRKKGKQ